ncbi:Uncharacterised protein [Streptococcus pneumoniae]|nr:Uncharacterised protein [Streptococcus pneumoniae]
MLADVLALVDADVLALVDADVLADSDAHVLAEVEALVEADSDADVLADSEADKLVELAELLVDIVPRTTVSFVAKASVFSTVFSSTADSFVNTFV